MKAGILRRSIKSSNDTFSKRAYPLPVIDLFSTCFLENRLSFSVFETKDPPKLLLSIIIGFSPGVKLHYFIVGTDIYCFYYFINYKREVNRSFIKGAISSNH